MESRARGKWLAHVVGALAVAACSHPGPPSSSSDAAIADGGAMTETGPNQDGGEWDTAPPSDDGGAPVAPDGGVADVLVDARFDDVAADTVADDAPSIDGANDDTTSDATGDVESDAADVSIGQDAVVDASQEDGATSDVGPTGSWFPTCVDTPHTGEWAVPPTAIAEVVERRGAFGPSCHCTGIAAYVTRRVICGTFDQAAGVATPACSYPSLSLPKILVIRPTTCGQATYWGQEFPMSDWDAILAEQIAAHSDAGDGGDADTSAD